MRNWLLSKPQDGKRVSTKPFYDVYIDDKPSLPANVEQLCSPTTTMFLRDHPYNQNAEGGYIRINHVRDVLPELMEKQLTQ